MTQNKLIDDLKNDITIKKEFLKLLLIKKTIEELDIENINFGVFKHPVSNIKYVVAGFKDKGLRKRVRCCILPEEKFNLKSKETKTVLKEKLIRRWKKYCKDYYPEYCDTLLKNI